MESALSGDRPDELSILIKIVAPKLKAISKEWTRSESLCAGAGPRAARNGPDGAVIGEVKSACKPGSVVDNHSSGTHVAVRLKRPTRTRHGPRHGVPIWPCSEWGLPCHACCQTRGALLPHHFTLTVRRNDPGGLAVYFLWHFPWTHAPQALPGTLPCGARTFLHPACARQRLSSRLHTHSSPGGGCGWQAFSGPALLLPSRHE